MLTKISWNLNKYSMSLIQTLVRNKFWHFSDLLLFVVLVPNPFWREKGGNLRKKILSYDVILFLLRRFLSSRLLNCWQNSFHRFLLIKGIIHRVLWWKTTESCNWELEEQLLNVENMAAWENKSTNMSYLGTFW